MNQTHLSSVTFDELALHHSLKAGLADAGFTHCTPIQAEALPVALRGEDVAGQAQTGTGKTAAFLLAVFNQLLASEAPDKGDNPPDRSAPRAIIIAPTRELALQIHHDAGVLGRHASLRLALAYGGTDYEKQRQLITDGVDVLVGTPGRLIDYLKQGVYTLNHIEVVVLDEADRMFDLGFIKDMRYILRRMPPPAERLNMLFSATLSHRVMELAYEHMNDPRTITIESDSAVADNIRETVYYPSNAEKIPLMVGLLSRLEPGRTLVFTNTKHAAERVGDWLDANGHAAAVLTGDVPQKKRESLLRAFTEGRTDILVATDVAARGLHIPNVSHVFNFDLPQDAEDYVHRIGRTARAGASGEAVSFACEDYAFHLLDIEEYIGHPLERAEVDAELLPELARPGRSSRGSGRGRTRDGDRSNDRRGRGARSEERPRGRGRGGSRRDDSRGEDARPGSTDEPVATQADVPAGAASDAPRTREGDPREANEVASPAPVDTANEGGAVEVEIPQDAAGTSAGNGPRETADSETDTATAAARAVIAREKAAPAVVDKPAAATPRRRRDDSPARGYAKTSKWNNPNIETPAVG